MLLDHFLEVTFILRREVCKAEAKAYLLQTVKDDSLQPQPALRSQPEADVHKGNIRRPHGCFDEAPGHAQARYFAAARGIRRNSKNTVQVRLNARIIS